MNTFIISPCGISTLLSGRSKEERDVLIKYANVASPNETPEDDLAEIERLISQAREALLHTDLAAVRRMSAEIGALTLYYEDQLDFKNDFHFLLSSDTWLGEKGAQLIREWLVHKGAACVVHRQEGLQMLHMKDFHNALAELAPQLIEQIAGFKKKHYKVVFNLTAGFKAVQGFLQTLGMFHADELIYLFERTNHLMRIPRIPVQIDGLEEVRTHLGSIRRLAIGLPVAADELDDVPETMLLNIDGEYILSAWGNIFWQEAKKVLYKEMIYPPPCNKVRLAETFFNSAKKLSTERLVILNQRIDQLCRMLSTNDNLDSLNFKPLAGKPVSGSTHEFYAWSDGDAKRCFGHFKGDIFIVDKLDEHL